MIRGLYRTLGGRLVASGCCPKDVAAGKRQPVVIVGRLVVCRCHFRVRLK